MAQQHTKRSAQTVTGVSNVAYNVLTILNNKLDGVAAMQMYKEDAQQSNDTEVLNLINELEEREVQDISKLKRLLSQRLTV